MINDKSHGSEKKIASDLVINFALTICSIPYCILSTFVVSLEMVLIYVK